MDTNNNQRNWVIGAVIAVVVIVGIIIWVVSGSMNSGSTTPTTPDGTPTGTTSMVNPYGTVILGLGQDGDFPGITIRPVSVSEDSRCQTGVQCIQAGTVRVLVTSTPSLGTPVQNTITLGQTIAVGSFSIGLNAVDPYPKAGSTIANSDYKFTFEVHQVANPSGADELEGKG